MKNTAWAPAFPFVWDDEIEKTRHVQPGMTLRQYAAIKLRVPNSGTDWLDDMIVASIRNDFAAKAMQSHVAIGFVAMCGAGHQEGEINKAIAKASYDMADAMIVARSNP
jgi:hypothetical protein